MNDKYFKYWRPDNWKNPYDCDSLEYPEATGLEHHCFEAGADAMLGAVVKLAKSLLEGENKELFAYGGPPNCEYCCLQGLLEILEDKIEKVYNND